MYFIMAAGGILGSHICHLKGTTANVHCGCSVGGNYGFLVIPLIMTLFGDQGGSAYIPICSVIDTTLVWTLGFTLFTKGIGQKENPWKKIIMNPIFLSILLGLCLTSFHVPIPDTVLSTIDSVGNTCYCWGLVYLGCSLGFMKLTNIFKYKSILVLFFTKSFVIPLIIYFIFSYYLSEIEKSMNPYADQCSTSNDNLQYDCRTVSSGWRICFYSCGNDNFASYVGHSTAFLSDFTIGERNGFTC